MRESGVRRVCCLLPDSQLTYYRLDLLKAYREAFGQSNVCHTPIEDYHLCDHRMLERTILPSSKRLTLSAPGRSSTALAVSGGQAMFRRHGS